MEAIGNKPKKGHKQPKRTSSSESKRSREEPAREADGPFGMEDVDNKPKKPTGSREKPAGEEEVPAVMEDDDNKPKKQVGKAEVPVIVEDDPQIVISNRPCSVVVDPACNPAVMVPAATVSNSVSNAAPVIVSSNGPAITVSDTVASDG